MVNHVTFSLLLVMLVLSSGCASMDPSPSTTWIDVRTPQEHAQDAITGHPNIPHGQIADRITALVSDKNAPITVYCASGRRAGIAKETLEGLGYTNVTNAGGIADARRLLETTD